MGRAGARRRWARAQGFAAAGLGPRVVRARESRARAATARPARPRLDGHGIPAAAVRAGGSPGPGLPFTIRLTIRVIKTGRACLDDSDITPPGPARLAAWAGRGRFPSPSHPGPLRSLVFLRLTLRRAEPPTVSESTWQALFLSPRLVRAHSRDLLAGHRACGGLAARGRGSVSNIHCDQAVEASWRGGGLSYCLLGQLCAC